MYLVGKSHGAGSEHTSACNTGGHHGELGAVHKGSEVFDLGLESCFIEVLGLVRVGLLGTGVRVAERHLGGG